MASVLTLRSASFGYADHAVVSGVDLRIDPGEVIALIGANGSGKSTVIKGVLGLNRHLGGTIEVFGRPIDELGDRTRLGYVPQRHALSASARATVREIVATGRLASLPWHARLGRVDHEIVADAIAAVGLVDRADTEVAILSGGQQRRVLIARALAGRPDILLLDEPTAGVDADSQHVLASVLAGLAAKGTTMLIVTHELAALSPIITRVLVMDAGRVRADLSRTEFERGTAIVHDHDHHHHDFELDVAGRQILAPSVVPVDPPKARRA